MTPGTQKLTRRQMVERLLAGIAAGGVWPMIGSSHPIYHLLKDGSALDRADRAHNSAGWKPIFLNQQQDRSLIGLSESIVPGSSKAQVNRFIDLLLSVDTKATQEKFVASLAAMQGASREKFGRELQQLTPGQTEELLRFVSGDTTLSHPFEDVKGWVSIAYYSSEEGMRELGWNGEHAFRTLPECTKDNAVSN